MPTRLLRKGWGRNLERNQLLCSDRCLIFFFLNISLEFFCSSLLLESKTKFTTKSIVKIALTKFLSSVLSHSCSAGISTMSARASGTCRSVLKSRNCSVSQLACSFLIYLAKSLRSGQRSFNLSSAILNSLKRLECLFPWNFHKVIKLYKERQLFAYLIPVEGT